MADHPDIERLRRAVAGSPYDVRLLHQLADAQIRYGRGEDAAATLLEAARLHAAGKANKPDLGDQEPFAATAASVLPDLSAIALLKHALRLDPTLHEARVILAEAYMRQRMLGEVQEQADVLAAAPIDDLAAPAALARIRAMMQSGQ